MTTTTRIASGDVTETLISATERAGEMDAIVIIGRYKESGGLKLFTTDELKLSDVNWILDSIKNYLLNG